MKQTFTLFIATIISISMYAYPYTSKISISSASNARLRVMVDGNRYKSNNNSFLISNLQQGYHTVKVYRFVNGNRSGNGYGNNSNYQLVYNANVYVKPQYHVDITINRFGKAFIDEQPINSTYNNDDDDWGDDDWNDNNGNNNDYNYNREMNAQSFSSFKQTLENESFDNTRMTIAKQVINTNYFTTAQVREVLQLFSFENNKLEIAKYAYKNTLDKNNYFSLADCFTFSSNKDELMRYIQNYR
jgi:hypothetical protein